MTTKKAAERDRALRAKLAKSHGEIGTFHVEEKRGKGWFLLKEARCSRAAELYRENYAEEGKTVRVIKVNDSWMDDE
jgi:hypothetical protein